MYQKPFKLIVAIISLSFVRIVEADTINIYSERQPVFLDPILEQFEKTSGHDVEVLYLDKGAIARLQNEAKHSPADLVIVADIARLNQLVTNDLVQPIVSKKVTDVVPARFRHDKGLWIGLTRRLRVMFLAKDATKTALTFEELADASWQGKLCIRSGFHPYNIALVSAYLHHHGQDKTKNWLKAIKKNLARTPQGNDRSQIKSVANGTCQGAIANLYYYYKMVNSKDSAERKAAKKVDWIALSLNEKGAHSNISGIAMTKYAPHKKAALSLVEFLISEKAQTLYAELNYELPVRSLTKSTSINTQVKEALNVKTDSISLEQIANLRTDASKLVELILFDN